MYGFIYNFYIVTRFLFFCRTDEKPPEKEPKFIVFYSCLLSLFNLFCFNCKQGKPKVSMKTNGTMVTVFQECDRCKNNPFVWKSQPYLLGKHPAGNILLSMTILVAGASVSKVLLICKHLGLMVYTVRTFLYHQKKYMFPAIVKRWKAYSTSLMESLKGKENLTWCGDGRFDSMGHCAKYGVYTMFCSNIDKCIHFELVQVKLAIT